MLSLSLAIVWTEGATSEWMIRIQQTSVPADGDLCFVLSRNGFFSREVPRLWRATCYIMDQSAFFTCLFELDWEAIACLFCRLLRYKKLSILFKRKSGYYPLIFCRENALIQVCSNGSEPPSYLGEYPAGECKPRQEISVEDIPTLAMKKSPHQRNAQASDI